MRIRHCFLAAFAMAPASLSAEALFESDTPIAISITAPFSSLARDDSAAPQSRPATIVWRDETGAERRIPLDVRARGKSRRREDVCDFPPIRLDFPKTGTEGTPFEGLNKVKLVTHCTRLGRNDPRAEQRVRLEYVVYRLYNRLTPASFRARPLTITYVDTDRDDRASVHPGFLLEPDKWLARRLDAKALEVAQLERNQLDPAQASLVEVFEYFIGNTDFSLVRPPEGRDCCHNSVPLALPSGAVLPVPYDFDSTGVVDPPYAEPLPMLPISDVRQRLFRGHCRHDAIVSASLDALRGAKEDLYAIVRDDAVLDERSKRSTLEYFDAFYETIADPKQVKKKILDRCI